MKEQLKTKHGSINLPAFMPDATYGSIKAVSFSDAFDAGVREVVTTTLHIEQKIGSQFVKSLGGVHKFFNWDRPILTDSGGWQVFSLIQKSKGKSQNFITDVGCSFIDQDTGKQTLLTPESSIQIQFNLGADIMTVLDNPILGESSLNERKESIRINTLWAKRAKDMFNKLAQKDNKPYLGAVIQGANDFDLRKQSVEELLEIDFDIFNFGGIPMHSEESWKLRGEIDNHRERRSAFPTPTQSFHHEMLHYVSELIPNEKYKYAMGIGQPTDIAYCVDVGWDLFDTVLPTRNARHGYLYVSEGQGDETKSYKNLSHDILRLKGEKHKFDENPVDENCDCECCRTVSRSYLRHLIRIKESTGFRLATIHNLHFYSKWMERIRDNYSN